MTEQQEIRPERAEPYGYARIPHIADEELDVYEYRLYGHYKRRISEDKENTKNKVVFESIETTSLCTGLSEAKIRQCRETLRKKGYITFESPRGKTVQIVILDIWDRNIEAMNLKRKPEEIATLQAKDYRPILDPEKRKAYEEKARQKRLARTPLTSETPHTSNGGTTLTSTSRTPLTSETQRRTIEEQQFEEEQEYPPPSFSLGPKTQSQPEPTPSTTQATKATGQSNQEASSAQAISKSSDSPTPSFMATEPPLPPELEGFPMRAPFKRSLPTSWTWGHVYIYRHWLKKTMDKAASKTDIVKTEGIYALLSNKTQEAPLTPATVAKFIVWWCSQDWVIKIAERDFMGKVEFVNLPLATAALPHVDKWLQTTRQPAYTPREYTAPPERSNPFSLGGGV